MINNSSCRIKKIIVRKLFGHYDYDLFLNENVDNQFLIFYGDNGCGKSTVLSLAFHLLAPEMHQGHKTAIARIPFKTFSIELSNGITITAERKSEVKLSYRETLDGYTISIMKNKKNSISLDFVLNTDGKIIPSEKNKEDENRFWDLLENIKTCYNLLSDNRVISISNYNEDNEFNENDLLVRRWISRNKMYLRDDRDDEIDPQEFQAILLKRSISKAEQWLRRNYMRAASQGESNVNNLYGEILRELSNSPEDENNQINKQTIIQEINKLELQSHNFSQYGLLPSFYTAEFLSILENAPDKYFPTMVRTLKPYLRSIEKKIDALKEPYNRVDIFINTLNQFFNDKTISMDINYGLKIKTKSNEEINPSMLSSGEKHLLLLFCNSLVMDKSSIIMIDEPEISLNIKWQRILLSSLMSLSKNQPVQYIFATHSIELLSAYRDHVIQFENINREMKQ